MAWSSIQAPDSDYHEWEAQYCPVPGLPVTVSFYWQVVFDSANTCPDGVPSWLNLRFDTDSGNTEHWVALWQDVCGLLTTQGWARATGWQWEEVTFTPVGSAVPANEALAFSIGGWHYDQWIGLVDGVTVFQ